MGGREHGGGSSAQIECRDGPILQGIGAFGRLDAEGLDECANRGFSRGMLVERAIGANSVAEGDVDVKMH